MEFYNAKQPDGMDPTDTSVLWITQAVEKQPDGMDPKNPTFIHLPDMDPTDTSVSCREG